MPNAKPTEQIRDAVVAFSKPREESLGFIEIAILSLAGLTVTLLLIAQGFGLDPYLLMISQ